MTVGPGEEQPPLLETLRFEPRMAAHLRESLRVLRDDTSDDAMRRRIDAVLEGRESLRELARSDAFADFIGHRVEQALAEYEAQPEEVRAADLERAIAEAHTPPPEDRPSRQDDPGTW
ncbi:hypothetical protein N802_03445 [Knoellia sinensis KCTC 19936]|uniref:Uncharacterized protein n=1 Tax=Knoellia sinensis KCTC 19936 TaxID=1385520 RepID=A0A0A0J2W2_9MICO|nr:hypothetical protein [Knoellia sinensis]KGN31745.1 hypothetical protein N802_03445 [Knoellia sinensis KCTC 19936]